MLLEVPLLQKPNQKVTCNLNAQTVTFSLYTMGDYLFADVFLASTKIIAGGKCVHGRYLNQYPTDLVGNIFFWCDDDLDPVYSTLGTVGHLLYADYDYLAIAFANWKKKNGIST